MLSSSLEEIGCKTFHANGDADVLIAKTAVESAKTRTTVLIGDDTDLLVLLCHFTSPDTKFDVFFKPEPKTNSSKRRVWNIKRVQEKWGSDVCRNILFIHAILGCDTTSRVHGIGKGASLKKFANCPVFREQSKVFNNRSTQEDIIAAGEKALLCLYNGNPSTQTLDELRYIKYQEKLATKTTHVQPQNLPPTSAAAKYHSLRVYHQIQQWKGEALPMENWGWTMRGTDQVIPVMTDLPAAPDSLLQVIRCNCSGDCSSRRCSCRKNSLKCSTVCGQCKGSACTNSTSFELCEDDISDDST